MLIFLKGEGGPKKSEFASAKEVILLVESGSMLHRKVLRLGCVERQVLLPEHIAVIISYSKRSFLNCFPSSLLHHRNVACVANG